MDVLSHPTWSGGYPTENRRHASTSGSSSRFCGQAAIWGLLLLTSLSTGCSCWQVGRCTDFALMRNARREATVYRGWALEALDCQYEAGDVSQQYADGFVSGFVDHVFAGGRGKPPLITPAPYWGVGPRHREKNHDWREGFREGAQVAIRGGYVEQALGGGLVRGGTYSLAHADPNDLVPGDAACDDSSCTAGDPMFEIAEEISTPFHASRSVRHAGPSDAMDEVPVPNPPDFINDDDPLPGSTRLDEPVPPAPSALGVEIEPFDSFTDDELPNSRGSTGAEPIGSGAATVSRRGATEETSDPFADESTDRDGDLV